MNPVASFVLVRVANHQAGYQPDKCYILAVTWGNWTLPDMYALGQSGIHNRQNPHARVTTITYT